MTNLKSSFCLLALIFVLFAQLPSGQATVPKFPQAAIDYMATRSMRYHHYMWHQVRENWNKFPDTTKAAFAKIGWTPPNPARTYDSAGTASAILDNYSGEDFLYMHRQMIATINDVIAKNGSTYGKVSGWTTLPAPGDKDYPVPANYTIPNNTATTSSTTNRKTDSYYTKYILPNEKLFKNATQLRSMTLAELGARMEVTIHSYLHMRFSAANVVGYRNSYKGTIPLIDKKWDNVTYDWMGDTYSSAVNPLFWKVHGWIDDRIEDWRVANNLTSIKWKGTWTGGPMSNLSSVINAKTTSLRGSSDMDMSGDDDEIGNVLQEAIQVLWDSGVEDATPSDEIYLPPLPGQEEVEEEETAATTTSTSTKPKSCKKKAV